MKITIVKEVSKCAVHYEKLEGQNDSKVTKVGERYTV